jgi:AraC-like DNA-binding protein
LVGVRLCLAAGLFDDRDTTIAAVAYHLGWSGPQALTCHLDNELGVTASRFRDEMPFNGVLDWFLANVVRPHAVAWQTFQPITGGAVATYRDRLLEGARSSRRVVVQ